MGTVFSGAASTGIDSTGGRGTPLALAGIQDTDDPCCWERSGQPWEVIGTPLGSGSFRIRKVFLATPNCMLYRESCATRFRVQALSPEGMLACAVPVKPGSQTSYFRRPLHERGLPATLPTGLEAMLDQGQEHLLFLVQRSLLCRHLPPEQVELLEAGAAARVLPACAETVRGLGRWLNGILARVHGSPEMLRYPAAVVALERELVLGFAARVLPPECRALPRRKSRRRRGYDRAIEAIRYADLTTLDLGGLCAAAGVGARALEYAFRENLGVSPGTFIRQLRLHALRRALLASAAGESTVTELAYHLGFTQLGRLAAHYRSVFGEPPSSTLARPFPGDYPPFWMGHPGGGTSATVVNTFP
ncbi:AraC family transcriptional regulator [Candidatus Thiodictyon syntrophicum]|uniref:AraC family transcriptional regulator n=1 Tax=Candidatus Thiodictyon syntrophicum TaxID=1166950 RepID=A0A2K8UH08_9GAMM|nr:AraC family transcriptional regulator [Candidatus Thiodictyon syntrophicum]